MAAMALGTLLRPISVPGSSFSTGPNLRRSQEANVSDTLSRPNGILKVMSLSRRLRKLSSKTCLKKETLTKPCCTERHYFRQALVRRSCCMKVNFALRVRIFLCLSKPISRTTNVQRKDRRALVGTRPDTWSVARRLESESVSTIYVVEKLHWWGRQPFGPTESCLKDEKLGKIEGTSSWRYFVL